MDKENRELLLKDLSGRLLYGVKYLQEAWNYEWDQEMSVIETLKDIDIEGYINDKKVYTVEDIRPYLRSLSSMTDEELVEYKHLINLYAASNPQSASNMIKWLNKHHFDYNGLIEKGLALEAPEEMYK